MTVKLLSSWRSAFGLRVVMALKEKGVAFEYLEQDVFDKGKLLLDSNPVYKKVPVLIHNGRPICESAIILQYIEETWPPSGGSSASAALLPQAPYERALVRFWADYIDKKVYEAFLLIIRNTEGELMEQGRNAMRESMVLLDGALRDSFGGGPLFGGSHINMVDIVFASYVCWFEILETLGNFKLWEESACPHLSSWAKHVIQQPSVKEGLSNAPHQKLSEYAHWLRKNLFGLNE